METKKIPEVKIKFDKLFQIIENETITDKDYLDFEIWKLNLLYDDIKNYFYEKKGFIK